MIDHASPVEKKTIVRLLWLALSSLAIYWLALVRPYGLFEYWTIPHLDINKISQHDPRATLAYVLTLVGLFFLYWLATRVARGRHSAWVWSAVIGGAFTFGTTLFFLYPVDAVDIFDYILRGRMTALYGVNTFYQTPNGFSGDVFYPYAGWYDSTAAYGPGWELLASWLVRLAGDNIITNVFVFKILSWLAFAGTALLIGLILRRYAPERALYGVVLFAWNPLALYITAGNGHNDAVMVLFCVLGFYFLARGNLTLAVLAETVGALIKFIPSLLVPLILLAAWKRHRTWRARVHFFCLTGSICLLLVASSLAPFWRGGDMLSLARRGEMFTTSLPTLFVVSLEQLMNRSAAEQMVSWGALVLLAMWILRELIVLWNKDDDGTSYWEGYARAGSSILLFYLLISCLWFQPWYVLWIIALAALLPESMRTRGTILLSFVAMWKMPIFELYIMRQGMLPPFEQREPPLTVGTLGVVWFYFVYQWRKLKFLARG